MTTGDQYHKRHVIVWLALVFITLVAINAVVYSYVFAPQDDDSVLNSAVCGSGNTTCSINGVNKNTNTVDDPQRVVTTPTPGGSVNINCSTADDCQLVDVAFDTSDCCALERCADYASDDFVAVNRDAYQTLRDAGAAGCAAAQCPAIAAASCAPSSTNDDYSVECIDSVCQKNYTGSGELPLTNTENL